jgi:hypothetical protein
MKKTTTLLFVFNMAIQFCFAQTIPLPPQSLDKGWVRIKVENLGTIDLPPNMEVQGGSYKEIMDTIKEINGISASKVIFQQKNLNSFDKNSFNTYARVFIRSEIGTSGDYKKLKTSTFSQAELTELNNSYKSEIKLAAASSNAKVLEWYQAKQSTINGMTCVTFGYKRQLGSNPPVKVTFYIFHNYDRMHTLTFEYRIADANVWESTFDKILKSYRITNIK